MPIKVNTAAVLNTANEIDTINRSIRDDFAAVVSAISALNRNWDGSASNTGIGKLNYIKKNFVDNRFNVVNDYAAFMRQIVGEGYEATEKAAVTAASAFK